MTFLGHHAWSEIGTDFPTGPGRVRREVGTDMEEVTVIFSGLRLSIQPGVCSLSQATLIKGLKALLFALRR